MIFFWVFSSRMQFIITYILQWQKNFRESRPDLQNYENFNVVKFSEFTYNIWQLSVSDLFNLSCVLILLYTQGECKAHVCVLFAQDSEEKAKKNEEKAKKNEEKAKKSEEKRERKRKQAELISTLREVAIQRRAEAQRLLRVLLAGAAEARWAVPGLQMRPPFVSNFHSSLQ